MAKQETVIIDGVELRPAHRFSGRKIAVIVLAVLVGLVAVGLTVFSLFRWAWATDESMIQGRWVIEGSGVEIQITEDHIVLSDDLNFGYTLDPFAKTIQFDYDELVGTGHYRFSLDGNRLAIRDGKFGWWDTYTQDLPFSFGALADYLSGAASPLFGEDDEVTQLARVQEPDAADEGAANDGQSADAGAGGGETADGAGGQTGGAGEEPSGGDGADASGSADGAGGEAPAEDLSPVSSGEPGAGAVGPADSEAASSGNAGA